MQQRGVVERQEKRVVRVVGIVIQDVGLETSWLQLLNGMRVYAVHMPSGGGLFSSSAQRESRNSCLRTNVIRFHKQTATTCLLSACPVVLVAASWAHLARLFPHVRPGGACNVVPPCRLAVARSDGPASPRHAFLRCQSTASIPLVAPYRSTILRQLPLGACLKLQAQLTLQCDIQTCNLLQWFYSSAQLAFQGNTPRGRPYDSYSALRNLANSVIRTAPYTRRITPKHSSMLLCMSCTSYVIQTTSRGCDYLLPN